MNITVIAALFQEKERLMQEVEKIEAAMEALGGEGHLAGIELNNLKKKIKPTDGRHRKRTKAEIAAMVEGRRRKRAAKILVAQTERGKRVLTPEGRANIVAAAKRRAEKRRETAAASLIADGLKQAPVEPETEMKPAVTFAEL